MGYVEKQSIGSLLGGTAISVMAIAGVIIAKKQPRLGYVLTTLACVADLGFFIPRFLKSQAVWPALTMIIAAGLTIAALVVFHFKSKVV